MAMQREARCLRSGRVAGPHAALLTTVFLMVVVLAAVCQGCAQPRLAENEPTPGGRQLTGQVISSPGMEFANEDDQAADVPTLIGVRVEGGVVDALVSSAEIPATRSWVRIAEGTNGRWFVIGNAEAPAVRSEHAPEVPSAHTETETAPASYDADELVALLSAIENDSIRLYSSWKDGRGHDELAKLSERIAKNAKAAERFRVWNTMYTPEEEATWPIRESLWRVADAADTLVGGDEDDAYIASRNMDPTTDRLIDDVEEWRDWIRAGEFVRVEEE